MPGKKGEKVVAVVLVILALDQLSKILIVKNLFLGQSLPVINGVFHLSLVHNRGAAFGILNNLTPLFILTSLAAVILIFASLKKNRSISLENFALSLILAGALGNLIDRIFLGYVIDFLDFRVWPVFNVADSAITVGAILLGWKILSPNTKKAN
ncbi:MAG: signal peptidase II [Candidatus Omnitrophota bacterium]